MKDSSYLLQDEPKYQPQNSRPFKKQSTAVMRQRQMIEQLQKIIILSDEENKKLLQQIAKITQKQKNTTIYYETKISQLQAIIQNQTNKIETLEQQKFKKEQSLVQSKVIKSNAKSYRSHYCEDNKENINNFNYTIQLCQNQNCLSKEEVIRKSLAVLSKNLEYLLQSLQVRQFETAYKQANSQYAKQFQRQKQRRKDQAGKDSLSILKNIQLKMNKLEAIIDNASYQKQLRSSLPAEIRKIKKMQQNLLKIPFLEKINVSERKRMNEDIVGKANACKHQIMSMVLDKIQ